MKSPSFVGLCLAAIAATAALAGEVRAARDVPVATQAFPARYVVAVGFNGPKDYEKGVLRYADDDAAQLYTLSEDGAAKAWLLTTFDDESARTWSADLVSRAQAPTSAELARTLGEAFWEMRKAQESGRAAELVLYLAGHGDVDDGGEGFVLLADGPFRRSALETQVLVPSPAKVNHIVVDACSAYFMMARSGSSTAKKGEEVNPDVFMKRTSPAAEQAWSRTGMIVATSGVAEVHESTELGSGVFSYLLRSALVGAGDVNGDGRVEYAEAAAFIRATSAAFADPRAKLDVAARAPQQSPHAPLADIATASAHAFLVVDSGKSQHVRLIDERGRAYAELLREPKAPTAVLALLGSSYFIVQRGPADAREEAILLPRASGAYAMSSLSWKKSSSATRAYLPDQTPVPYGPQFVSGFLASSQMAPPADGTPLTITWAGEGEPAARVPWWTLAGTSFVAAGVLATGAMACAVGNSLSLAELDRRFRETGTLDPSLAVQTDTWLAASALLAVGALTATAAGGGLTVVAIQEDE